MRTLIKQRKFNEWPQEIRRRLWSLTFRESSGIRDALHESKECETFVLFEGNSPVAWAVLKWCAFSKKYDLMFYTRRDRRRLGYGRKLHRKSKRWLKKRKTEYIVFPDGENDGFFIKVGEKIS